MIGVALFVGLTALMVPTDAFSQSPAPVELGSAGPFAVLGGSTVTSTGNTIITGDIGLDPGTAVEGFPPGIVNGAIHIGDTEAVNGKADLTTAYNDAAGRTTNPISVAGNLGGQTLPPGLYKSTSSLEISSGNLTLDGGGDPNAVWIFQMAATLTVTSDLQVVLSGEAQAANVFWQVGSSATIGTNAAFSGTILADQSVTLETGASLNGRALARIAAVTLDNNAVTVPTLAPVEDGEVTLTLPDRQADPNVPVHIPVTTDDIDGEEVFSYEFTVTFDPDVVTLDRIEKIGTLSENAVVVFMSGTGTISVSATSATAIAGSGPIILLTGRSHDSGSSDLTFADLTFNDGTPIGIGIDGSIQLGIGLSTDDSDQLPASFALLGNYPNPFNPSTTILFDLPESAEISIQLFDLLGRQVMSRPPTTVHAGADRGVQIEGSSLSSGTYIYRVIARSATSTMIKSGRLTLVK